MIEKSRKVRRKQVVDDFIKSNSVVVGTYKGLTFLYRELGVVVVTGVNEGRTSIKNEPKVLWRHGTQRRTGVRYKGDNWGSGDRSKLEVAKERNKWCERDYLNLQYKYGYREVKYRDTGFGEETHMVWTSQLIEENQRYVSRVWITQTLP